MTARKRTAMSRLRSPAPLGPLERAIMDVLWSGGPVSAVDLHHALDERGVASTTVATELPRLVEKGLVTRARATVKRTEPSGITYIMKL